MPDKNVVKTDGKKEIIVSQSRYASDELEISICRNGFQSTVVSIDEEMLQWLHDAIAEYLGS